MLFLKSASRARTAPPWSRMDCHSWIIAVRACVVDLLGLQPYCLSSRVGCNTDWSQLPIKDSKTLATVGSREIGLRAVWIDRGRGIFGTAITSADFQMEGTNPSRMEALNTAASGSHRYGAKSRRSQFGRPSGPGALKTFILARRFATSSGSMVKSEQ